MLPGHVPFCLPIHASSFARGWAADEFEALLDDHTVLAQVITDGTGQHLDGFAISRKVLDEAELLTIAVESKARGYGIGRQLLTQHLTCLASAGAVSIFLEVEEANAAARALYDRAGFQVVGRREGYYAKADATRATALVMKKQV